MIIAFDVSYVQKGRAGLGRYATELLKALVEVDQHNEYKLHGWSYSLDVRWLRCLQRTNVALYGTRVPGFFKRIYWNRLRFPPIETFIGEFDVFQSVDPFLPPTRKKKTVATVHDLCSFRFPHFFEQSVLRWDKFAGRSVLSASAIIVPSLSTLNDVLEHYQVPEARVKVVRPPVNALFRPDPVPLIDSQIRTKYNLQRPFVLFVGTLEPRKNVLSIIKAFELLHRKKTLDIELVIVGKKGWMFGQIFEAVANSPVRAKIRYIEFIPDGDLAAVYRNAELFVYPSIYEGHGSPVVEAMASGKAVVTSNTSSLKEIAEGSALLVDPSSIDELAHAMETLLEDTDLRKQLSARALKTAERFSGSSSANELLALYQSLL